MSGLVQPRQVAPGALKRWVKESLRLGGRVWMTLLAFSVLGGLAGGWVAQQGLFLGFVACLAVFGLWQAMLLHTAERAAAGKRVTVSDAFDGLVGFWRLPGKQAQVQLKVRLVCSLIFYAFFMLVIIAPLFWFLSSSVVEVTQAPQAAEPRPTVWALLTVMAGGWMLVFFWSWLNQRGGIVCSANMLVRRYGVDWDMALALWEKAVLLNHREVRSLYLVFLGMLVAMVMLPVLVFPLEVFWVCLVTVAGRDMFEQEEALAPQEARVKQGGMAPV